MHGTALPTHVLQVLHSFPPHAHGGIETYVRHLAQHQLATGMRVTVLAGSERDAGPATLTEEHLRGVRVLRLRPRSRRPEHLLRNPDLGQQFEDLLDREGIDLVHVHHWHNVSSDLVARSRGVGVPAVVTLHDAFAVCPRFFRQRQLQNCPPDVTRSTCVECCVPLLDISRNELDDLLRDWHETHRAELRAAVAVLTLSHDQATYLREVPQLQGVELVPVVLPAVGLDARSTYVPTRDARLRIVTWGGMVPGKGLHVLVDACESLPQADHIEVHHYGRAIDGEYTERVRQTARRTRVQLHGSFDAAVVESEFPLYDVAVFPSLFRETYGYVVDEAMGLGLPVVVSDLGAPPERIGQRGLTFPPGDVGALAAILATFLEDPRALPTLRAAEPGPLRSMDAHWGELSKFYELAMS